MPDPKDVEAAWHQAGHAVAAYLLLDPKEENKNIFQEVSIQRDSEGELPFTFNPNPDLGRRDAVTGEFIPPKIPSRDDVAVVALAGLGAESLILGGLDREHLIPGWTQELDGRVRGELQRHDPGEKHHPGGKLVPDAVAAGWESSMDFPGWKDKTRNFAEGNQARIRLVAETLVKQRVVEREDIRSILRGT